MSHMRRRPIGLWVLAVPYCAFSALALQGLVRTYGVSTSDSDGLLPTYWERGLAPYLLIGSSLICVGKNDASIMLQSLIS